VVDLTSGDKGQNKRLESRKVGLIVWNLAL